MTPVNYKQLFSVQAGLEKQLKQVCPNIAHKSGIYFWFREDKDENKKYMYIGKGVDILRRNVSHMQGYQQHIDISIKKRGFYSAKNQNGWKLSVLYFPENELDAREQYYIDHYKNKNYILYNIESGGTLGKTIINERKPAKTYRDGIKQGEKNTTKQVKTYFDKYLDYSIKSPSNKLKERKFAEFTEFLNKIDESEN